LLLAALHLALTGLIDVATWKTSWGHELLAVAAVGMVAGIALLVTARGGGMTRGRLFVLALGSVPFGGFGAFLAWQIGVSAERSTRCEAGDAEACMAFAVRKLRRGDHEAAIPRLRRACELGDAKGCFAAGGLAPAAAGVELLARACELGEPKGCSRAAQHLRRGEGVTASPERACGLARAGCLVNDASSCEEARFWAPQKGP
jgi:hypothetical protein